MPNSFDLKRKIFKGASTTYYYSSLFFTPETKDAVFTLYAYVRYADDLIDSSPPRIQEFKRFRIDTERALSGEEVGDPIIDDFAKLARSKGFDNSWTWAFLDAMESDITVKKYDTYRNLKKYMYGSAEVIGLYMSKIFESPVESYEYAKAQGEAMQFINFVRDVKEDHDLGRQYIPTEDLQKFKTHIPPKPDEIQNFCALMRFEISRYRSIQKKADVGHTYIDRRFRIMVKTSADMYGWTATQIERDPMIVFSRKVKPPKWLVIFTALKHAIISLKK